MSCAKSSTSCAVRPEKSALVLETLLFADEVRDPVKEIDVLPVEASFESREIEMAKLLIDSMTTAWEPERYNDTYRERVEELIDQKRQGTVVVNEGPRAEPAPVVDLLAALQASVSAARGRSLPFGDRAGGVARSGRAQARRGAQANSTAEKTTRRRAASQKPKQQPTLAREGPAPAGPSSYARRASSESRDAPRWAATSWSRPLPTPQPAAAAGKLPDTSQVSRLEGEGRVPLRASAGRLG